ncbi:YphA family membrane protein [Paraliobacillus salinarum]|uniref:YphA family membrane protein n=1 Tax=Paraliobacillus salinarum TaxID=1158996 RepID=UPI003CCD661F
MVMKMIIIHWFLWIIWIFVTFLMNKGTKRTTIACFLLLFILLSSNTLTWHQIELNLSIVLLSIISSFLLIKSRRKLFLFFVCLCISHFYAALQLWNITNPVWVFAPKLLIFSLLLVCFILFVTSDLLERFVISVTSIIYGEIIYSIVVYPLGWNIIIGDVFILNLLAILSCIILLFHFYTEIKMKLQDILVLMEQQNKRWTNE